jgi:hypothetical protein
VPAAPVLDVQFGTPMRIPIARNCVAAALAGRAGGAHLPGEPMSEWMTYDEADTVREVTTMKPNAR